MKPRKSERSKKKRIGKSFRSQSQAVSPRSRSSGPRPNKTHQLHQARGSLPPTKESSTSLITKAKRLTSEAKMRLTKKMWIQKIWLTTRGWPTTGHLNLGTSTRWKEFQPLWPIWITWGSPLLWALDSRSHQTASKILRGCCCPKTSRPSWRLTLKRSEIKWT